MNRCAVKLPLGKVYQIGPQMERIDMQPTAFLPELLLEPIGKGRDVGRNIPDSQREASRSTRRPLRNSAVSLSATRLRLPVF